MHYFTAEAQRMLWNRPGWWPLLARLLADVAAVNPAVQLVAGTKYGAIRVRLRGGDDPRIAELIRACEHASSRTCETCGGPGKTRWFFTWVSTLCDACALTHPGGRRSGEYPPHADLAAPCPDCGYESPAE